MSTPATFTKSGTKATTPAKLDKDVFAIVPKNHELLKSAYVTYLSNDRDNLAVTKTRGLVRGGGKKPWKQKGTGRARFGSSRNPIWRGGGIAFGPTGIENYHKKLNVSAKRLAIRQALSLAAKENKVAVIESFDLNTSKTAQMAKLLSKIGADRRTLLVVDTKSNELVLATRNLQDVKLVQAVYVNVFDVMNANLIVISSKALPILSEWLGTPPAKGAAK